MGQKFGIPIPKSGFTPFINLPREAIESLWLSYNLIGEGWALQVKKKKYIYIYIYIYIIFIYLFIHM